MIQTNGRGLNKHTKQPESHPQHCKKKKNTIKRVGVGGEPPVYLLLTCASQYSAQHLAGTHVI